MRKTQKGGVRKMKKKNRNIPLISFIRIVFIISIFLLVSISLSYAEEKKKYPPYPDVWGYELPWPDKNSRRSGIDIAKMPFGDHMITYVKKWTRVTRKDGSCCDSTGKFAGVLFFAGKSKEFTESEYNEFWIRHRDKRVGGNQMVLSDGSFIEQVSIATSAHCPDPFRDYYIVKKSKYGEIEENKMFLYLYDRPQRSNINRYCERNSSYKKDYILKRADSVYVRFVLLEDDTFLIYDTAGNFVIRFDKNFNTKSNLINNKLFVINRIDYENIYDRKSREGKINDQEVNDALAHYLINLQKEGKK